MKSTLTAALAAALFSAGVASAATVTVNFDGPTSFASIDQFYNGGTDTAGVAGPNLGISFGLDALGLQNDAAGPYFSHAPSPIGVMSVVGPAALMNVFSNGGFSGVVSLFYSSSDLGTVKIYSGYNGSGSVLGQFNLTNNATTGCVDSAYCNWTLATLNLGNNVARSIDFGGAAFTAAFDNLTVETVPLPAALPMLAAGLAGLGALSRRKKGAAIGNQVSA